MIAIMRIAALITAAGLSSRAGDFKPMMKLGAISIIHRLILTLRRAGCSPIVLITGHQAKLLENHVRDMGVICLRNEDYSQSEMFDSVKIGLEYLQGKCDSLLFTPVDVPLFTVNTIRCLISTEAEFAVPVCGGESGHPLLINEGRIRDILSYDGRGGLNRCIEELGGKSLVEVGDPGTLWDVDTPMDYKAILRRHNQQMLRPVAVVQLAKERPFFGPALALLLSIISECGCVQTACKMINMSYSKGWSTINEAEKQLGFLLIQRQQGGKGGGGSCLTQEGEHMLRRFNEFEAEFTSAADKLFEKHFPDLG